MRQIPRLKTVTVCAADCVHPDLAAWAIERCMNACEFGDAVLFADKPVAGPFRFEQIGKLDSVDAYTRFCLREMPSLIRTDHVLVVQWDGFVVDPSAWDSRFLSYDYVGAPWYPDGVVGNGGFSLRSRRLMDAFADVPLLPGRAEDVLICRLMRADLEKQRRIRFAPTEVASRFSYETMRVEHPTFGFHGLFNMQHLLTEEELLDIVGALGESDYFSWQFLYLIAFCIREKRVQFALRLYQFMRRTKSPEFIKAQAFEGSLSPSAISTYVDFLEARMALPGM